MIDKVKALISENPSYGAVIKIVRDNPYAERKDAFKDADIDSSELDGLLARLEEEMIVLPLTSMAASNIESRVSRKVYLLNPELDAGIDALL